MLTAGRTVYSNIIQIIFEYRIIGLFTDLYTYTLQSDHQTSDIQPMKCSLMTILSPGEACQQKCPSENQLQLEHGTLQLSLV